MSVMFKTQQGRTLFNADLTPETLGDALGSLIEVTGFELGDSAQWVIHVSPRHVVEWWEAPDAVEVLRRLERSLIAEGLAGSALCAKVAREAERLAEDTLKP